MGRGRDYVGYAAKMRHQVLAGTDLEVEVRFVDMITRRGARILDIGCGIGSAVNGLRARGHAAYGVDPTPDVLEVAEAFYGPSWFRKMAATDISPVALALSGLPESYDAVLMSGNVPSFLSQAELEETFSLAAGLLEPGGTLVVGTTTAIQGGPVDQDRAAAATDLALTHRYSDWHLGHFRQGSPWSVSVFAVPGSRDIASVPDGKFILGG
jgi:SAM-dependent methyltransferase